MFNTEHLCVLCVIGFDALQDETHPASILTKERSWTYNTTWYRHYVKAGTANKHPPQGEDCEDATQIQKTVRGASVECAYYSQARAQRYCSEAAKICYHGKEAISFVGSKRKDVKKEWKENVDQEVCSHIRQEECEAESFVRRRAWNILRKRRFIVLWCWLFQRSSWC